MELRAALSGLMLESLLELGELGEPTLSSKMLAASDLYIPLQTTA